MLKMMDTSRDGVVSLEEHLSDAAGWDSWDGGVGAPVSETLLKDDLEKRRRYETHMFQAADVNGDGVLDKNEISALVSPETRESTLNVIVNQSMQDRVADAHFFPQAMLSGLSKQRLRAEGKEQVGKRLPACRFGISGTFPCPLRACSVPFPCPLRACSVP
jgi:hypothetical protein